MATKSIEDATAAELRDFAEINLGLPVAPRSRRDTLIAQMRDAGFDGDEIDVPEPVEEGPAQVKTVASDGVRRDAKGRRLYKIVIHATEEAPEGDVVPLAVNGVTFPVKRGIETDVPEEYVHVLRNAVTRVYDRGVMADGQERKVRDVPSYPWTMVAG